MGFRPQGPPACPSEALEDSLSTYQARNRRLFKKPPPKR